MQFGSPNSIPEVLTDRASHHTVSIVWVHLILASGLRAKWIPLTTLPDRPYDNGPNKACRVAGHGGGGKAGTPSGKP